MKGYTNNPYGRPKGSPNKSTKAMREALMKIVEGEIDNLKERLKSADSKTYFDILMKLLPFVLPKLAEEQLEEDENNKPSGFFDDIIRQLMNPTPDDNQIIKTPVKTPAD